ncbi:MepB family protein [Corynebacterium glutamicum]|uniref:MepB family protein n=1 Tax=Corynebacterium glutamicum TaxID=1718 RepID=UPI0007449F83|nr:MepB family protein [Corynebacterium glutamicum]AMA00538.1 metallopeptidase [Corynebacterium glutamicum]
MSFSGFELFIGLVADRYGKPGTPHSEEQHSDYEAGTVLLGSETWHIRTARVTPTKPGAFVAFWTRNKQGETCPFDTSEACAGLLIFVQDESNFGVFRFTREQLEQQGITRSTKRPGKRGFRVYPSWSGNLNAQAKKTQAIQTPSFELLQ